MIHVIATIEHQPGRRAELLVELQRLVPLVRAEAGCFDYVPALDVASGLAAQAPVPDDAIRVVERWVSLDALRTHSQAAHMQDFRDRVKSIVVAVQLQVFESV